MSIISKIPVSVLITTKNEEKNIARCLAAVQDFAQIIVIDSNSEDLTCEIAHSFGATVFQYVWNGKYPKKRGWSLENIEIHNDWIFWVDADEVLTKDLVKEIGGVFSRSRSEAGFFVRGQYVWGGVILRHGLMNNKITLFNRHKMAFPIIDDLDIYGMGEIEGHYQPVLRDEVHNNDFEHEGAVKSAEIDSGGHKNIIGQIAAPLLHYAHENQSSWDSRHERYANWEAEMNRRNAWPLDPMKSREILKRIIRTSIFRPYIMFAHSYFIKLGLLDGRAGYDFAKGRMDYYKMIFRK